jgi:signal transduction histidine kinase
MSHDWPKSQLVDGFTSYGRLVELPAWLAGWQRRAEIRARLDALEISSATLAVTARHRAAWLGGGLALAILTAAAALLFRQRRRRAAELEELRTRLARDLHDEIGSNLAGLAVLSESLAAQPAATPATREDWLEVNRIAHESTDAMREVLWVVGAREEAGLELPEQLRRAAARALAGRTVNWTECSAPLAADWPAASRRQAFLFFKEALANVARHSAATVVDLSAVLRAGFFELTVADHGRGFDSATAPRGIGLASLRDRARTLGGTCTITSAPDQGTRVTLRVPVAAEKISHP